jgi:hypothetical protein
MRSYLRYLRIGWTVLCVLATLLLCVLWVRSYWDPYEGQAFGCWFASTRGIIAGCMIQLPTPTPSAGTNMMSVTIDAVEFIPVRGILGFSGSYAPPDWSFQIPYWCPVVLGGLFAAAPWIGWSRRFTLRTLLIAITAVAVVLGLIVWLVR